MGRRVERWVADDGESFDSQEAMLAHELSLVDKKAVKAFLSDPEEFKIGPRKIKEYERILIRWQEYSRLNELLVAAPVQTAVPPVKQEAFVSTNPPLKATWEPKSLPVDENGNFVYSQEEEERQIDESFK